MACDIEIEISAVRLRRGWAEPVKFAMIREVQSQIPASRRIIISTSSVIMVDASHETLSTKAWYSNQLAGFLQGRSSART